MLISACCMRLVVVSCWILFVGVWRNLVWLDFHYGWWKSWSFVLFPVLGSCSLSRCFVQYAHLRVILTEFGVIRRLWRGSRDQCLLSDCCMVSLNLFVCGKCRLVAVSVGEHVSFLWKRFFDFLGCFELWTVEWGIRWWIVLRIYGHIMCLL